MIKLTLPIYYTFEYKKKKNETVLVGMNFYRNAHFQKQNKIKQDYHNIISEAIRGQGIDVTDKIGTKYQVRYKLYYKNSQSDLMNVVSVIDKFLQDSLQELGLIENDNVKHYIKCEIEVGGEDKVNPRIECEIMEEGTNG